jgi:peptidoglycan hydrolase-like amidase
VKSVDHIDLFIDKPSSKVYGARIKERSGAYVDFTILDLYDKLSPQLKSSDFTISMTTDLITFEGYGSGMGTGLCLYTSQEKGKKGATMQEILSDFFPFTYLQKIEKFGNQPSTIR